MEGRGRVAILFDSKDKLISGRVNPILWETLKAVGTASHRIA